MLGGWRDRRRTRKLAALRIRLLDLEHDRRKWGYADIPSEAIRREDQIAKVTERIGTLERAQGGDGS